MSCKAAPATLSAGCEALGRLDVQEFLSELLRRVRAIVDADTAAVLLLDEGSGDLVARAACGLEEEVHQAVHVPLGRGFAGRVAAGKRPVALNRVDSTTVTNPILWEKGIRAMLGVPLLAGDRAIGVLHVGRLRDEPFTAQDTEVLEVVAERVAGATQVRQLAVEHAAAALLERSLLPGRLPKYDGLELAVGEQLLQTIHDLPVRPVRDEDAAVTDECGVRRDRATASTASALATGPGASAEVSRTITSTSSLMSRSSGDWPLRLPAPARPAPRYPSGAPLSTHAANCRRSSGDSRR